MTKFDLSMVVLTGLTIVSVVVLLVLKLDVSVLLPITTAFVGYLLGNKKDAIVGAFKK